MRDTLNEPGFWMMVFGTVIIAMLLFAGNGDCADQAGITYTVAVTTECTDSSFGIGNSNPWPDLLATKAKCRPMYHHYMGIPGQKRRLVGVTEQPPSLLLFPVLLARYEKLMEE